MGGWINGLMDMWMGELIDGLMDACMNGRTDGWTDGQADRRTDIQTDRDTDIYIYTASPIVFKYALHLVVHTFDIRFVAYKSLRLLLFNLGALLLLV